MYKKYLSNTVSFKVTGGFTLIELSIVIVIIGLIVAGVVGGQSLVNQSKVRSQIAEFDKYKIAYNAFKLEYDAIPGDFNDASSYWGVSDGNGDRRINSPSTHGHLPASENMKFFEHLSQAGLLPQSYNNTWQLDLGYPSLKIDSGKGLIVAALIDSVGSGVNYQLHAWHITATYKSALFLNVGRPDVGNNYDRLIGTASPKIYHAIDQKIDDGVAMSGIFKSYKAHSSSVGDCLNSRAGDYLLTNDQAACHAIFIIED